MLLLLACIHLTSSAEASLFTAATTRFLPHMISYAWLHCLTSNYDFSVFLQPYFLRTASFIFIFFITAARCKHCFLVMISAGITPRCQYASEYCPDVLWIEDLLDLFWKALDVRMIDCDSFLVLLLDTFVTACSSWSYVCKELLFWKVRSMLLINSWLVIFLFHFKL